MILHIFRYQLYYSFEVRKMQIKSLKFYFVGLGTVSLQSSGSIGRSAEIPVLSSVEYLDKPAFEHIRELTERNKKSRNIKLFVSSTFK